MRLLLSLLLNGFIVYFAGRLLSGVTVEDYGTALIAAVIIGILNFFIKPILTLLTLPVTILTLGLFLLVINGLVIMMASSIVPGFAVAGIGSAILFAIVLALLNLLLASLAAPRRER